MNFKKTLILLSLILNLFLTFIVLKNIISKKQSESDVSKATIKPERRIAALIPISHPSLEQISKGFLDTLKNDTQFDLEFKLYNANGNRVLMRSLVEDILSKKYDLVFTIATSPTQMMQEVSIKNGIDIPIVFGAASIDPQAGIVDTYGKTRKNVTGVSDDLDLEVQIDLFKFLKPNLRSVLLVYDASSSGLERYKDRLEKIFLQKQVKFKSAAIYNTMDISQKVPSLINEIDSIFVLKDNLVVSSLDILLKLCNENGITLMMSDLDSIERGAALAFGVREYDIGVKTAEKALEIMKSGKSPNTIPVSIVEKPHIKINLDSLKKQNLNLSSEIIFLMQFGEVYTSKGH